MAIRIRLIRGTSVAVCAAKTKAKEGDLYLNDNIHHALSTKFALDFESEGLLNCTADSISDEDIKAKMLKEERG